MRILIVSYRFAPYNSIGAVRVSKAAACLTEAGHDVRVVTAEDQPLQPTLPLEIPEAHVAYTPWMNVNRPVELALGGRKQVAAKGYTTKPGVLGSLAGRAGRAYKAAFNLPDGQVGWIPYAVRAGRRLVRDWRPDVIFASAPPYSSLVAASLIASGSGVPWVAEFRDLWLDNPYYEFGPVRRRVERWLESPVVSSADGLVAVTAPAAEVLRARYLKPTAVVMNGFDPADYPTLVSPPKADGVVRLVYTGILIPGKRDPATAFEAAAGLGPSRSKIRFSFYGRYLNEIEDLAARYGVGDLVDIHPPVSHREALKAQAEADALLLILWPDPREDGVCPGKVFEYLGARRPILVLGSERNVAAKLVSSRGAGRVCGDAEATRHVLASWIEEKGATGRLEAVSREAIRGLARRDQFQTLASFLEEVAS